MGASDGCEDSARTTVRSRVKVRGRRSGVEGRGAGLGRGGGWGKKGGWEKWHDITGKTLGHNLFATASCYWSGSRCLANIREQVFVSGEATIGWWHMIC